MNQQVTSLIALAVGGAMYYLADPQLGIALLAVGLIGAVGHFDARLDDIAKKIEKVAP